MNTFTVSFFGHRKIEQICDIKERLDKIIRDIISQKDYVTFLVGNNGEFDQLVSSTIKNIADQYGYGNTNLILILPYMKAGYRNNKQNYLEYYDDVEICAQSSDAYFKSAIQIRNKSMVDRSDLVVCCIQHKSGGAYKTVQYAEKQGCKIINVAD